MASLCETAPLDCHFIDPRYNATTGTGLQTPQMLGSDGIHPNEQGYKILAEMIWDVKTEMNIPLR
jgi:lysophospholipase L1-like esterase